MNNLPKNLIGKNGFFGEVCMPLNGVSGTDAARVEQLRTERRSDEVQVEEQRRTNTRDTDVTQARQVSESGRGEQVDVSV